MAAVAALCLRQWGPGMNTVVKDLSPLLDSSNHPCIGEAPAM